MSSSNEGQTENQYVETIFRKKLDFLKKRIWIYLFGGLLFAVVGWQQYGINFE